MKKIDMHVHSNNSHDSKSPMEYFIKLALIRKIYEIYFTEHYHVYDCMQDSHVQPLNMKKYTDNFSYLKEKYAGQITINLGLELGLQPSRKNSVEEVVTKYPFDFIIGSSPITCKKNIAVDDTFFNEFTKKEAYTKYFEEVFGNIAIYNEFDVYGHLDYVCRYGNYEDKSVKYSDYAEILDEILKLLISKGKGIEVNSSGYRLGLLSPHPNIGILKRYKELGGEILTIGSDAHAPEHLCHNFELVADMLKRIGFKYHTIFKKRTPTFIPI